MRLNLASKLVIGLIACSCAATAARGDTLISRTTAARYGLVRPWFAQVSSASTTGVINHVNYDRGVLLVQTDRSLLNGLDAETGRTLWSVQIGAPNRTSTEPAGNEKHVVVVNGSVLYVLDRLTGRILWTKQLDGTPGAGPGVCDTHAFVPMLDGRIEGFELESGSKPRPWVFKSAGNIVTPPLATPQSISWTTNRGYYYVADPASLGIRYRLETRGAIHSRPAYWTPNLYACSTDGCVYAVDEAKGKIQWKFAVGDAIFESPVAIADKVFVVAQLSGMYCLGAKAGEVLWQAPKMQQFVSLSPTRVYAVDRIGQLVALDAKTGRRLTTMPLAGVTIKMSNNECDRIYLANDAGVIQCLRETDLKSPVLYSPPPVEKDEAKTKAPEKKEKREPKVESIDETPAEGDADAAMDADAPAETPDAPAEGDADPFK